MKIKMIQLIDAGPLDEHCVGFDNQWSGGIHDQILLSGVNGSGKSTLLRSVAHLWSLAGKWLSTPGKPVEASNLSRKWLQRQGSVAVFLDDVPVVGKLALFYGTPDELMVWQVVDPDREWLGETYPKPTGPGRPPRTLLHREAEWLPELAQQYRQLVLTGEESMPNMIHLDGEERRWIAPRKGLGEVVADDPQLKWLVGYRATEDWQGQLESSLIAQKTLDEVQYRKILNDLNEFLSPKRIDPNPDPRTLRLRVETSRGGRRGEHSLDDLSAGEHQILIQLYLVSRWLNPGGIVMIDEPDLHLHPSLLNGFHTKLEQIVKERDGQLILTSHNPELWRRYENIGKRVRMGEDQ